MNDTPLLPHEPPTRKPSFLEIALDASIALTIPIDREKILFFRDSVRTIPVPSLTNKALAAQIAEQQRKFCIWLEQKAKELE